MRKAREIYEARDTLYGLLDGQMPLCTFADDDDRECMIIAHNVLKWITEVDSPFEDYMQTIYTALHEAGYRKRRLDESN